MNRWYRRALAVTVAVLLCWALPSLYDMAFERRLNDPLVLYSPARAAFVYRIDLGDHQSRHLDESGSAYDQAAWEGLLPFVYYKNLEKQNLLPLRLAGRSFSAVDIEAGRQAVEIKARHLTGRQQRIGLYPLFNNDPAVVTMPFPEELFRVTDRGMEFVGADHNRVLPGLSSTFTGVLREHGFVFPATAVGGKTTNLKPFDEGYFIRDAAGTVFHVRRVLNRPEVVKTPIDPSLDILDIIVAEHSRRAYYGVIVTRDGRVLLITYDDYRLVELPAPGYDPAVMDLKLLFDPLAVTVVSTGSEAVTATAVDHDGRLLRKLTLNREEFERPGWRQQLKTLLFPVQITTDSRFSGQADPRLHRDGFWSAAGVALAFVLLLLLWQRTGRRRNLWFDAPLVLCTGAVGLLTVIMIEEG